MLPGEEDQLKLHLAAGDEKGCLEQDMKSSHGFIMTPEALSILRKRVSAPTYARTQQQRANASEVSAAEEHTSCSRAGRRLMELQVTPSSWAGLTITALISVLHHVFIYQNTSVLPAQDSAELVWVYGWAIGYARVS